eukprot:3452146-Prorocentrum_lima.AAC.1
MPMPRARLRFRVGCPLMTARTARWQIRAWMAVIAHLGIPHPSNTVRIQCQGSRSNALLWSA